MTYEEKIVDRQVGRNGDLFASSIGEMETIEERYPYIRILVSIVEQAHPEWNQAPTKDQQISLLVFRMSRGGVNREEVAEIVRLRDAERGFNYIGRKPDESKPEDEKPDAKKPEEEKSAAETSAEESEEVPLEEEEQPEKEESGEAKSEEDASDEEEEQPEEKKSEEAQSEEDASDEEGQSDEEESEENDSDSGDEDDDAERN